MKSKTFVWGCVDSNPSDSQVSVTTSERVCVKFYV